MQPKDNENLINIGRISGPFGIKGEMRVVLSHITPEVIMQNKIPLILEKTQQVLNASKFRVIAGGYAFVFKEIPDRNVAETYLKSPLLIDETLLPESAEEDGFFLEDIIGFEIKILDKNEIIGVVENIYDFGAGDIIEFIDASQKSFMFPANEDLLLEVDFENRIIYVSTLISSYIN